MSDLTPHRRTVLALFVGAGTIAIAGGSSDEIVPTPPHTLEEHHTENDPLAPAEGIDPAPDADSDADVDFAVTNLELADCGTTCRDATIELTNTGTETATNVHGTVTVVADETPVWEGEEHAARLEGGDAITREERIELDFGAALAVQNNNRQVTVTTTIMSDQQATRTVDELSV